MKYIKLLPVICLLIFSSCITQKKCSERFPCVKQSDTITKDSIIYIPHDSLIELPADSSYIQAYLGCVDENGNLTRDKVRLMQIIAYKSGSKVNLPDLKLHDSLLSVICKVDSSKVAIYWFEKYVNRHVKIKQVAVNVEYRLKTWQAAFMWAGICLSIAVLIWLIFKFGIPLVKKAITGI